MSSDNINHGEELRIINDMLTRTRRQTAEGGNYFIVWGILLLFAVGTMWGLIMLKRYEFIWINWILYTLLGVGYSIWQGRRIDRIARVKSYAATALQAIWSGLGIGFIFLMFIGPVLGLYTTQPLFYISAVLTGGGTFATGLILGTRVMLWSAAGWWLGALALGYLHGSSATMGLYMLLLVVCYLLPGIILKRSWK